MRASRRSHTTSSYGCTPLVVKCRRSPMPTLCGAIAMPASSCVVPHAACPSRAPATVRVPMARDRIPDLRHKMLWLPPTPAARCSGNYSTVTTGLSMVLFSLQPPDSRPPGPRRASSGRPWRAVGHGPRALDGGPDAARSRTATSRLEVVRAPGSRPPAGGARWSRRDVEPLVVPPRRGACEANDGPA